MTPDLREAVADLLLNAGCGDSNECEAIADAILALPALSVPEGWVAVPREVVRALRAAKALCDNINEFGKITDGEIYDHADEAIRQALSAIPSPGGDGSSRGLADQPSASRSRSGLQHGVAA